MVERQSARDGDAGAVRAGRRLTPEHSRNRRALQCSAEIDELLWRLGDALGKGRLTDWELNFARSILGQAKRGRGRWSPSEKQLAAVRRIIAGLAEPAENLIDDGAGDGRRVHCSPCATVLGWEP